MWHVVLVMHLRTALAPANHRFDVMRRRGERCLRVALQQSRRVALAAAAAGARQLAEELECAASGKRDPAHGGLLLARVPELMRRPPTHLDHVAGVSSDSLPSMRARMAPA